MGRNKDQPRPVNNIPFFRRARSCHHNATNLPSEVHMPKPTSKQKLMSLLGFINYFAKFLPQLAQVSQPLRDLTTESAQFVWSSLHDRDLTKLKRLVSNHPVPKYYDINEEVTLHYNASEKGLGATLLQSGQPVAFASQTLSLTERRVFGSNRCT